MADKEIDSFVQKFKMLRVAGMEATLNLETKLGEVWMSLNCKVGRDVPPPPMSPSATGVGRRKSYRSPSYYRRQARRRAEREAQIVDGSKSPLADQAINEIDVEADAEKESDSAVVEDATDIDEESMGSEDEVETDVDIEVKQIQLEQKSKLKSMDPEPCISTELDTLIQQSQKNRVLWEKFGALPP